MPKRDQPAPEASPEFVQFLADRMKPDGYTEKARATLARMERDGKETIANWRREQGLPDQQPAIDPRFPRRGLPHAKH